MRIKTVVGTSVASICGLALAGAPSAGAGASTTSNQAAATKSVTAAFTTLFNAKDKNKAAKEALLEDSSKYKGAFTKLFDSKVAKANPTSAQVTNVTFPTSAACETAVSVAKCAAVTYNLDSAKTGASLLPNVSGYATEVKGHWLVSDVTFCALEARRGCLLNDLVGRIRRS
jgi:hypothetical protein